MALRHGFCTVHRIGYNRDFDRTCPQCLMARMAPAQQLDFDVASQAPLDASTGKPLDSVSLAPVV